MVYWIYQTRAGLIRVFKGDPHSWRASQVLNITKVKFKS
jgi:hypothetical protein